MKHITIIIILLLNFTIAFIINNGNIKWDKSDFNNNNTKLLQNNTISVLYDAKTVDSGISKKFDISKLCNNIYLSYNVYFPPYFDFVKGGKLPGLYGGDTKSGCSGCIHSEKCFSTRLMWRKNGKGEIYLYSPNQKNLDVPIYNDGRCGISLGRGNFEFNINSWINVEQNISLNDNNKNNGFIKLWINNKLYIEKYNIEFQKNNIKNTGIFFSTFYGGSSNSWAPEKKMNALFSDFKYKCQYTEKYVNNQNQINITKNKSANNNLNISINLINVYVFIFIYFNIWRNLL